MRNLEPPSSTLTHSHSHSHSGQRSAAASLNCPLCFAHSLTLTPLGHQPTNQSEAPREASHSGAHFEPFPCRIAFREVLSQRFFFFFFFLSCCPGFVLLACSRSSTNQCPAQDRKEKKTKKEKTAQKQNLWEANAPADVMINCSSELLAEQRARNVPA